MDEFYNLIQKEREKQDNKWGIKRHDWNTWSTILTEECGEVAKASLEISFGNRSLDNLEEELIQVAAVSKAIYEHIQEIKNKKLRRLHMEKINISLNIKEYHLIRDALEKYYYLLKDDGDTENIEKIDAIINLEKKLIEILK